MALKNELVRVRSARKRIDPAKYLRQGADSAINTNHIAINACRAPNPLESEKLLDGGRWHALDELVAGHWFDLDSLLVYALKLSILEKWDRISSSDAVAALESALAHN
jgi:hypothetical protein